MKLIIVRHGETEENVEKIVQGHKLGILTNKGLEQAKKLGQRLKDEKIDVIFSSDLLRAKNTTREIEKYHNIPVHYDKELNERCMGIFEGRPVEEYEKALNESGLDIGDFRPEGGESFTELRERAKRFLERLREEYKGKTVLISSHGWFSAMLLGILLNMPIEEAADLDLENASINIIELGENAEHKAHLINSIEHL